MGLDTTILRGLEQTNMNFSGPRAATGKTFLYLLAGIAIGVLYLAAGVTLYAGWVIKRRLW